MIVTMHSLATMHSNVVTEIRLAHETGYDGIEFFLPKLERYFGLGYTAVELASHLQKYKLQPTCINALLSIERQGEDRKQLLKEAERLCTIAANLGCPILQIVPFNGLSHLPYDESFDRIIENVRALADIGSQHNIRLQLEVIAWTPIRTLKQGLEIIDRFGGENVGLVVDFWHLWAGEGTRPEEVANLDKNLITGIHFCDGKKIPKDRKWEESELRGFLAGEGDIPLQEWCDAANATGFDGPWSCELTSPKHWEWDTVALMRELRRLMLEYSGNGNND